VEWAFLLPLIAGILTAVVALASLLDQQLEERPTILAGLFFGLVVGSVIIAWGLLKVPMPYHYLVGGVVGMILFVLLGLGEEAVVENPGLLAFLGAGALAICAMILPGISGSLILLLIGMYPSVLNAVDGRDLVVVGVFTLGTIVGLGFFSQVLHWALRRHHDVILAALVGLMAGSLRVLWPWPDGVESSGLDRPGRDWLAVLLAAVVGFGVVFIVSRLSEPKDAEISEPQPAG
jgi:putative membrane protein